MAKEKIPDKTKEAQKDSRKALKYVVYILIVLVATGISLWLSLRGSSIDPVTGEETANIILVIRAFGSGDVLYILIITGLIVVSYLVDGFIIFVFCRLYTRKYKMHQGLATALVGQFYSDVTPGASGGQVMQVYTMKSQGIVVSNAASITVMWFILYQTALLLFDVVAFIVESGSILSIRSISIGSWEFPMLPLIIGGFLLNLSVILLLFTMSFWHGFHNFILNHVVNFLAKIKLVKKPEETRENLRVQVENFKIELKRLSANIPVVLLIIACFLVILFCRFSIPYFAGMALHAWDVPCETSAACSPAYSFEMQLHSSFLGAFHQMVTGLLPLPGAAGVSEYFYEFLFSNYFTTYNGVKVTQEAHPSQYILSSTQILWRTFTFHIPLIVSGFTAAFYRSRPKEPIHYANRKTFLALTMSTLSERQASAETMYETRQMSRKALQNRLNSLLFPDKKKEEDPAERKKNERLVERVRKEVETKPPKPEKKPKPKKTKKKVDDGDGDWESWTV